MDIEFIWLAAPLWKLKLLMIIIVAQIALTVWLYIQMSNARGGARKTGIIEPEDYAVVGDEPPELAIYTRALANQFELPVLFYVIVLSGIALGVSSLITIFLGALFVIIRILHAREMLGENDVLKRRGLFINSMRVFLLMVIELVISTFVLI